jgi:GDP-L-fucose synthase
VSHRIYVAGHTGLVGSALVRRLRDRDPVVRTRAELDLRRREDVSAFFRRETPETVFLCAATVGGIEANRTRPAEFIADNLLIETSVIHAAYETGVKTLVFFGSTCLYPRDCPQPMKESQILTGPFESTSEPYSVAKLAGLTMCQAYNRQYGTRFLTVIPATLYGPNDDFDPASSHVLSALLRRFHENRSAPEVVVWGSGAPVREFLYVDDLVDALLFLLDRRFESPINIGTGEGVSIRELADLVRETVGFRGRIAFDTTKPDGAPRKVLDVSRLAATGWSARTTLRDGLKKTYDWWLTQA